MNDILIDGFGPLRVVRPTTVAELGSIVRHAREQKTALYPFGGQTMLGRGNPPTKAGHAVDMTVLDQVIDYPARDMTITVQAGITIARLQEVLAKENQWLPIDVPHPDRATLGGAIATNVSGSRRFGYGTLRDYVIGISAVNDHGDEFKAGGRVVKNVAGYDLCKLLVGSLGTLGIITQVTLKVRPRPEGRAIVSLSPKGNDLEGVLQRLHGSRTRPVSVDLIALPTSEPTIEVGYEGHPETVRWQVSQLTEEMRGLGLIAPSPERGEGWGEGAFHPRAEKSPPQPQPLFSAGRGEPEVGDRDVVYKANVLPSNIVAFLQSIRDAAPMLVIVHIGNGIVRGVGLGLSREQAASALDVWRAAASKSAGRVIVEHCPFMWKDALSVWGPPPADAWLMRKIKDAFDPERIFNPGRFVDGI